MTGAGCAHLLEPGCQLPCKFKNCSAPRVLEIGVRLTSSITWQWKWPIEVPLPLKALSKSSSLCLIRFLTISTHRSSSLRCLRHTFSLPGFVLEENTLLSGLGIEDGGGCGAGIGGIIHVVEAGATPHGAGAIPQGAGGPENHGA
jgi:hypothetical protein